MSPVYVFIYILGDFESGIKCRSLHVIRGFLSHGNPGIPAMGICWLRQQRRIPLDVVQCNEVLRSFAQGAAGGDSMKNLTDNPFFKETNP